MSKTKIGGMIGVVVGGVWFANNYQYFDEQGISAIGMPAILLILGIVYFIKG